MNICIYAIYQYMCLKRPCQDISPKTIWTKEPTNHFRNDFHDPGSNSLRTCNYINVDNISPTRYNVTYISRCSETLKVTFNRQPRTQEKWVKRSKWTIFSLRIRVKTTKKHQKSVHEILQLPTSNFRDWSSSPHLAELGCKEVSCVCARSCRARASPQTARQRFKPWHGRTGRTGWGECFDNQTRPLTYEIGPSELMSENLLVVGGSRKPMHALIQLTDYMGRFMI